MNEESAFAAGANGRRNNATASLLGSRPRKRQAGECGRWQFVGSQRRVVTRPDFASAYGDQPGRRLPQSAKEGQRTALEAMAGFTALRS
jgi:hypothetical protein